MASSLHMLRGDTATARSILAKSIKRFGKTIELNPSNFRIAYYLVECNVALGRYKEAERLLAQARQFSLSGDVEPISILLLMRNGHSDVARAAIHDIAARTNIICLLTGVASFAAVFPFTDEDRSALEREGIWKDIHSLDSRLRSAY
jgi:tetratricopeptide (TPR) repeat protein